MSIHRKPKPTRDQQKFSCRGQVQGDDKDDTQEADCAKYGHSWSYSVPKWCTSCGASK